MINDPPRTQTPDWLTESKRLAEDSGFILLGIAPAVQSAGHHDLIRWIDEGYSAGMHYFQARIDAYRHPNGVMPGTKSVIALAYPYPASEPADVTPGRGRVARYAWSGIDYHDTIHRILKSLKRQIQNAAPEVSVRGCVDTAPLMEREIAELAGLGWRGKNTLLLSRSRGSYFFLACLLLDVELPYDQPHEKSYCGSCTACLDECPTDAFVGPGVLDANRCISYLTIEHRDAIPVELRAGIGQWVFGCDVCQEVCPWNRKVARNCETTHGERVYEQIDLVDLLQMNEDEFRRRFRKSPFWRTRLRGMQRNAAIVLGNQGDRSALAALRNGTKLDDEMVAEACRWGVEQIEKSSCG